MPDPLDLSNSVTDNDTPKIDMLKGDIDLGKKAEEYFDRGNDFIKSGDYDRAIAAYSDVIHLKPETVEANNNRGNLYNDVKQDY